MITQEKDKEKEKLLDTRRNLKCRDCGGEMSHKELIIFQGICEYCEKCYWFNYSWDEDEDEVVDYYEYMGFQPVDKNLISLSRELHLN